MQKLEKILEEIEQRVNYYRDHATLTYVDICAGLREAEGIIRKHMDDGWISVDERLPEAGQEVWISVKTDYVRRGMYTKHFGFGVREGFICSDGFVDINAVNAWKLYIIPEPYCPKVKVPERKQEWKE